MDGKLEPSRTFMQQIEHLKKVFLHLKEAKLKLLSRKSSLFKQDLKFLGHIVSESGVASNQSW